MEGDELLQALKKKYRVKTDTAMASKLGLHVNTIQNLRSRADITPSYIANLIENATKAAHKNLQATAIRPLTEFYKIEKCKSNRNSKWQIFDAKDDNRLNHPYRSGLRDELDAVNGVYIFFDSRGRAIYTGKAKRQTIWREINAAFNRDRGSVQRIKRVHHPESRVQYKTSDETIRQIKDHPVGLHEIAAYFSAYEVIEGMIDELESLLVRSFANDLLNIRMERFSRQRPRV